MSATTIEDMLATSVYLQQARSFAARPVRQHGDTDISDVSSRWKML